MTQTKLAPLPDVIRADEILRVSKGFIYLKNLMVYALEDFTLQADGSYFNNTLSETISLQYRDREQFKGKTATTYKTGQPAGQSRDNKRGKGELSQAFDAFLSENREEHYKRDVAEIIGTTYRDESFQKLLRRRKDDGVIRVSRGGDKIRWINKDWKLGRIDLEVKGEAVLPIALPFGADHYIQTTKHSEIVVAGDVGSGKTHWAFEIANLNLGKLPIRHFFSELGDAKTGLLLEDYPNLEKSLENGYELINLDKEALYVADNLDPDGLNIYDYLHLPSNKEWFLYLGKELATLSQRLNEGVIVVLLQKKRGNDLAMGGDTTRMQADTYFTLNVVKDFAGNENVAGYKECRLDIIKARGEWGTTTNPAGYHTCIELPPYTES